MRLKSPGFGSARPVVGVQRHGDGARRPGLCGGVLPGRGRSAGLARGYGRSSLFPFVSSSEVAVVHTIDSETQEMVETWCRPAESRWVSTTSAGNAIGSSGWGASELSWLHELST